MRRIGTIDQSLLAKRFVGYLHQQSIDAQVRPDEDADPEGSWTVWIRDEEHVETCRQQFKRFVANPDDDEFRTATVSATDQLTSAADRVSPPSSWDDSPASPRPPSDSSASRDVSPPSELALGSVNEPDEASSPIDSFARQTGKPLVVLIIFLCVIASLTTNLGNPRPHFASGEPTIETRVFDAMSMVHPQDFAVAADPYASIKRGQVWRFLTPMFLHGSELHLTFNLLWLFFLGVAIERLHGSVFLVALLLASQVIAMIFQVELSQMDWLPEQIRGGPHAIGISGAVYGLFGFLWIRPIVDHRYPIHLDPLNVAIMLGSLVLCLTPLIPNVANGAHLGGLLVGAAIGSTKFLGRCQSD